MKTYMKEKTIDLIDCEISNYSTTYLINTTTEAKFVRSY